MSPDAAPKKTPAGAPDDMSLALSEDMLAAEYVLGTLDPAERDDAKVRIASDFSFAALVHRWERRLGELHVLTGDAEPPGTVWDAIATKLQQIAPSAAMRLPEVEPPTFAPPPADAVERLRAGVSRWRNVSVFLGALAAALLALVWMTAVSPGLLPEKLRPKLAATPAAGVETPSPTLYVAVLQRDAIPPAFILTFDTATHTLTLRRLGAPREAGKTYELWLISSRFPAPRSLGLVGPTDFTQSSDFAEYDSAIISDSTFAVSLEPDGGSPTGAPSNLAFLGKPVESTPPPASESEAH
jgi:anti-sigma-K factor RskA